MVLPEQPANDAPSLDFPTATTLQAWLSPTIDKDRGETSSTRGTRPTDLMASMLMVPPRQAACSRVP